VYADETADGEYQDGQQQRLRQLVQRAAEDDRAWRRGRGQQRLHGAGGLRLPELDGEAVQRCLRQPEDRGTDDGEGEVAVREIGRGRGRCPVHQAPHLK